MCSAIDQMSRFQDAGFMSQLSDHLPSIVESFRPDLILYDAGVDPHVRDELGKLNLTDQGECPSMEMLL